MLDNEDGLKGEGNEFITSHRAAMRRVARDELDDKGCEDPAGHAEDIASEVGLTLLLMWRELKSPEDAMYVFTVNKARTHARSCRREFAGEITDRAVPYFSHPGLDPEEGLAQLELVEWVMARLSDGEREVFAMRFFLDMSYASIADRLHKPVGTVTSTYTRAIKRLRKEVAEGGRGSGTPQSPAPATET